MSTCFKCGRELPGTEVECEDGCPISGSELEALEPELARGSVAAYELVKHVIAMGAAGIDCSVEIGGRAYRVTVQIIS